MGSCRLWLLLLAGATPAATCQDTALGPAAAARPRSQILGASGSVFAASSAHCHTP